MTEDALRGARRPPILQFERELQLRFRARGDHAVLSLQSYG